MLSIEDEIRKCAPHFAEAAPWKTIATEGPLASCFGNSFVVFQHERLLLRFVRDRDYVFVEVGVVDVPDQWWPLEDLSDNKTLVHSGELLANVQAVILALPMLLQLVSANKRAAVKHIEAVIAGKSQ